MEAGRTSQLNRAKREGLGVFTKFEQGMKTVGGRRKIRETTCRMKKKQRTTAQRNKIP